MADLNTDVRYIKGIGEAKAKSLGKLGIATLGDLINWFPRRYEDRREIKPISQLIPGEPACVSAMIASEPKLSHIRKGMDLVKVRAVDDTGALDVTFFNQSWLKNQLRVGETYTFYGRAEGSLLRKSMASPIAVSYTHLPRWWATPLASAMCSVTPSSWMMPTLSPFPPSLSQINSGPLAGAVICCSPCRGT